MTKTSQKQNEPDKFTAGIGCEWAPMLEVSDLSCVVIFSGGADNVAQVLAFYSIDNANLEDLWP